LLAAQNSIASVAFPAISTGIFEYPRDEAAVVSSETIRQFLASNNAIEEVRMVFFAQGDAAVFLENQKFE
jgi:O-acetyl-ADP-ribose deacetylase